ncbi:ABC transporter substrate-binding protein [Anaerotignum lactatifermentans]|uniref:ABC transporter substrate-binding protein n=1 Tax=Anaerotignum lactatifermentans TaxID=160404 RepID=A0ABS2GB50_9FIRM|nr:ABC transporter substrate-binding protein [Anaerotignum lactatifermentans]MBM6830201.1 ABC transporter substrate-binding protein [Anaerotignum lactatifermentans]MBM6878726.1 ABC transporter substrate-binding protein [Anaerotignum lactatifermentans]MBM6951790.1 ABC transporter substrate-binding protein [Anaerotignum lactatifermentans]
MKKRIFMIITAAMLMLSGCSSFDNASDLEATTGEENAQASMQQTLVLSMRVPETLNPLLNRDASVDQALKLVFMPLVSLGENGKVEPSIAQSWAMSEDGRTLSLTLRDDLYWHNGAKVTADDVAFSFRTILSAPEDSVYAHVADYVSSVSSAGESALTVTFHDSFSKNMAALCFPVIPESYYSGQTEPGSEVNMRAVGCGPYQMESYTMASSMILTAYEPYFTEQPSISRVEVKITSGEETDLYSFNQGILDVLATDASSAGRYTAQNDDVQAYAYGGNVYDFIGFNFHRDLFQSKTLRQSVAYAVPKEYIWESVYLQNADMTNTPISPVSWLYEENVAPYNYDPNMSATLLKNDGWSDADGNGTLEKINEAGSLQTLQITILVNEENTGRKQIASRLAEELKAIGFAVTVDRQPFEIYQQKFESGDYDLVVAGWQTSYVTDLRDFFATDGNYNYIGYSNEEIDALLESAAHSVTDGQILLAYSNLQKKLAEELPYISIAYRQNVVLTSDRVGGEITPTGANIWNGIEHWTLRTE